MWSLDTQLQRIFCTLNGLATQNLRLYVWSGMYIVYNIIAQQLLMSSWIQYLMHREQCSIDHDKIILFRYAQLEFWYYVTFNLTMCISVCIHVVCTAPLSFYFQEPPFFKNKMSDLFQWNYLTIPLVIWLSMAQSHFFFSSLTCSKVVSSVVLVWHHKF